MQSIAPVGLGHTLDLSGLDRTLAKLGKIQNPDAAPLMLSWFRIIEEDNRKGIMAGLDKDGVPLAPVTYRPLVFSSIKSLKPTQAQRGGRRANATRGAFQSGAGGNLSPSEYRRLGGPPLAPRGPFSRVVTNLRFYSGRTGPLSLLWQAVGYWDEVESRAGVPFLHWHFAGSVNRKGVRLPRRDLRGVRPEGRAKAKQATSAWMKDIIRSA